MRVMGLTGGISTGKTTVGKILAERDVPLVDADVIARRVVQPGKPANRKLKEAFGPEYFHADGTLNREKMGTLVFSDSQARRKLNACTHPYIRHDLALELLKYFFQGHSIVVLDSALLIETKTHHYTWPVVVVNCPRSEQLQRLMQRDSLSMQEAENRINAQLPMEEKLAVATVVIDNSGLLENTRRQVLKLINHFEPTPSETRLWYYTLFIPLLFLFILLKLYAFLLH